jgi:acyl carrier protein
MSLARDEVMAKVRDHLAQELGVDPERIADETRFREDLDADSLDLYELVMELEDTYGIKVSEEEAAGIETVGQAVFVDSSPKISDVKVNDTWRTFLIIGEGAGGTFYQTFDVTLDGMSSVVTKTDDDPLDVLAYFDSATSVPLVWSFPRYSMFDVTRGCNATTVLCTGSSATLVYGELSDSATDVEKTVGETWSDPAVGQIETSSGPYAVLVGSGFYKLSMQTAYRGGTAAGTTFYVLDAATGEALASRNVGNDGKAETGTAADSCDAANDCTKLKNALQADPVATGPSDSRYVTKAYLGDLDGRIWRFDISLGDTGAPQIATPVKLYDAGERHPMFSSMATVNVGTTQQYLFQGTGSEFLPTDLPTGDKGEQYKLLVILDSGTTGTKKAEILLTLSDNKDQDEKVTSFPAVAGDIVFFATTSYKPQTPCETPIGNLYAFTFIGGPAYDTNGDGALTTKGNSADKTKIAETAGRASAPFIVDQHLVFATGTSIEMFGDDEDFNNGVGQAGVRILSWREVR